MIKCFQEKLDMASSADNILLLAGSEYTKSGQ